MKQVMVELIDGARYEHAPAAHLRLLVHPEIINGLMMSDTQFRNVEWESHRDAPVEELGHTVLGYFRGIIVLSFPELDEATGVELVQVRRNRWTEF